jgi:uncharacterized protein
MSKRSAIITLLIIVGLISVLVYFYSTSTNVKENNLDKVSISTKSPDVSEQKVDLHPMAIESLRNQQYEGGDFVIEEKLANGSNFEQYVVSYKSEGFKIYGVLTIPVGVKPANGFPAIVFVHGYIAPSQYVTTENYKGYQANLANAGFVTFKPDLRGHGKSEGEAVSAHFSEKYVIDILYAIEYLKNYKDVDKNRIGYWGHSNGGEIGLRVAVVSKDIKAYSFWAGVVGSYVDMFETYNSKIGFLRDINNNDLVIENGMPSTNPNFWNKLDPYNYLDDINAPIQLQHGTGDTSVPVELSVRLNEELIKVNKSVTYFEYPSDNHNISNNVSTAFDRDIKFFRDNL